MGADRFWVGLLGGLVAPVIGMLLYALIITTSVWTELSVWDFLRTTVFGMKSNIAPAVSISLFANVGLFFLFDRRRMFKAMRGILASMFIYGIVILVLLIQWGREFM
jgi:hypothetical protein